MLPREKIRRSKVVGRQIMHKLPAGFGLKRKTPVQFAAICYRRIKSGSEVLLLTSRDSGRWVVPKGWPIEGLSPSETAQQEAWEEGGVSGKLRDICLGVFDYDKVLETGTDLPVSVAVFPIEVKKLADDFPEVGQRRRKWFTPKKAAARVNEPDLKQILRKFDPQKLR